MVAGDVFTSYSLVKHKDAGCTSANALHGYSALCRNLCTLGPHSLGIHREDTPQDPTLHPPDLSPTATILVSAQ